jgi:hypothetical protein
MGLALGQNRTAEAAAQIVGQFIKVRVAVNLNGHLGRITYDVAVVAPLEVIF